MIRPNMVSVERSRCARNARSATSNASRRFIADLPPIPEHYWYGGERAEASSILLDQAHIFLFHDRA
jgi:hypothetical protein